MEGTQVKWKVGKLKLISGCTDELYAAASASRKVANIRTTNSPVVKGKAKGFLL